MQVFLFNTSLKKPQVPKSIWKEALKTLHQYEAEADNDLILGWTSPVNANMMCCMLVHILYIQLILHFCYNAVEFSWSLLSFGI